MKESKQQIMNDICLLTGLPSAKNSTGSTTPRDFLLSIAVLLGIPKVSRLDKPHLARAIVESAGLVWLPEYESRGSTVTRAGVAAVRDAVRLLLRPVTDCPVPPVDPRDVR